ncbi:hypothetical protein GCM10028822_41310 [Hymenobacter terrigena]
MKSASELSRRELDELCSKYEELLLGPMQQQQLAINGAWDYFKGIPKPELTPELSALEELFSDVARDSLREELLEDLEIMRGEFATPKLQNEFWFSFQHIIHVQSCRLEMYALLAQKVAAQYGFKLPSNPAIILEGEAV